MASPPPLHRPRPGRRSAHRTAAALVAGLAVAVGIAGCSSNGLGSPATTSSTSSSTTSTTAVDPGPGPTSLAGVTIGLQAIVKPASTSTFDPTTGQTGQPPVGVDFPTAMTTRPGRNQLWIAERSGGVRILSVDTTWNKVTGKTEHTGYTLLPGKALDLSSLTTTDGERGLLGLAFSTDGRTLFVDHTATDGDVVVAAYTVEDKATYSGGNGNTPPQANQVVNVDPSSRRELLTIPHRENNNHNGGQLLLGPDGYLYVGVGDGGGNGDVPGNAQNTNVLLGKILRIDPSVAAMGAPYSIPPDNPFANGGGKPEIYLFGVRNPWRFSFDTLNGDLWIGDVGQDAIEEIDWLPHTANAGRGANLGWNWFEGKTPYRTDGSPPKGMVDPLHTYTHDSGRCSITGGYVYRGTAIPKLDGAYLYGDYCTGEIRGLLSRKGIVLDDRALGEKIGANSLVSFGQDDQGELYVLSSDGTIYRVVA